MLHETKEEKRNTFAKARLCLDGVLSLREVCLLLLLLLRDERSLVLGKPSADGAGLLGAEVKRSVPNNVSYEPWMNSFFFFCLNALLALVEQPELSPLVGVDNGEDLGDTLADVMNAGELGVGTSGDLGGPELDQLALLPSAFQSVLFVSESWATYDLRSASWDASSSLDLFHSWAVFCNGCEYESEGDGLRERGFTYDLGGRLWAHC